MFDVAKMIFFTLVALGVLVTIHEFGHFWVARRCGVKVLRFSIGFGKPFARWYDKQGTEFVLSVLPLGGYVKMVDESDEDIKEEDIPYAFNRKSVWQRMAVVVAGPLANFILAIAFYWLVYLMGVQGVAPIVEAVTPDSIAAQAGLEKGQEIVAVDGEPTPTLQALGEQLVLRMGEEGTIQFTVRYPKSELDADLKYEMEAKLNGWQVDDESPDPIASIGIEIFRPKILPIAKEVVDEGAAHAMGMESGDRILSMDGIEVNSWRDWVNYIRERPEQAIEIEVERGDSRYIATIVPKTHELEDGSTVGKVGMSVVIPTWPESHLRTMEYSIVGALERGLQQTWKTTKIVLDSIKKMLTGNISTKHLSGPITIAKVAGASAHYGVATYLGFLALLSVSLGVLNLLPIPVLDGGHLLYYVVEIIKGSPVAESVQKVGYRLGMMMVVGLMVVALYNDVMRL